MNILLIEDTESIIKGLTYSFKKDNHNLIVKTTVEDSKEYLLSNFSPSWAEVKSVLLP